MDIYTQWKLKCSGYCSLGTSMIRVYIVAILYRHFCGRAGKTEEYKAGQGPALLETSAEWGCLFFYFGSSLSFIYLFLFLFSFSLFLRLYSQRAFKSKQPTYQPFRGLNSNITKTGRILGYFRTLKWFCQLTKR